MRLVQASTTMDSAGLCGLHRGFSKQLYPLIISRQWPFAALVGGES